MAVSKELGDFTIPDICPSCAINVMPRFDPLILEAANYLECGRFVVRDRD